MPTKQPIVREKKDLKNTGPQEKIIVQAWLNGNKKRSPLIFFHIQEDLMSILRRQAETAQG